MFETMRRRIALMIAPELASFEPTAGRAKPSNDRLAALRDLGDQVREVAAVFNAAGGSLPVWKADREWLEGMGFDWPAYNAAKTAIRRLVRDQEAGVTGPAHLASLQLLSLSWPAFALWPRHIPRPPKSKDAA